MKPEHGQAGKDIRHGNARQNTDQGDGGHQLHKGETARAGYP